MIESSKRELQKRIEQHLRVTSRQLIKFDTENETLHYLIDSFKHELLCDFVGIFVLEQSKLIPKLVIGESSGFNKLFPIEPSRINNEFFNKGCTSIERAKRSACAFTDLVNLEQLKTWFSVPLKENASIIGICLIGYKNYTELIYEVENQFEEFGQDLAAAIMLVREKEFEKHLYLREQAHKKQLNSLLEFQQSLIKKTIEEDHFDGILSLLCQFISKSIILYDQFARPITSRMDMKCQVDVEMVHEKVVQLLQESQTVYIPINDKISFEIWKIEVGGNVLGYLAIESSDQDMDELYKLTIELSLNVFSNQFIKQKLVYDAKDQVKDGFINKLLGEDITDSKDLMQYANVFNWDLFKPHRAAVLFIQFDESESMDKDIFKTQEIKSRIWEQLKNRLTYFDSNILSASKEDVYIIFSPVHQEKGDPKGYWKSLHNMITEWTNKEAIDNDIKILMGIGSQTKELKDYYLSYQQGIHALNVIKQPFEKRMIALYEELGSYTLLQQFQDHQSVKLFINHYLKPVIDYSKKRELDFLYTLRVYLNCNGNLKETAETLFIHRSTLQYRLDKLQELLGVDLNSSEVRFNLQMAIRLYDLFEVH